MNKRGVALIISFMVIAVLVILGSATISSSMSERFISQRYTESNQAFWLAEAGVASALLQLKADPANLGSISAASLGKGEYSVDAIVAEGPNLRITAHGFIPSQAAPRAERRITVLVQSSGGGAIPKPDLIDYAIDTTGTLNIKGSAKTVPVGSSHQGSSLDFEDVFGMTKDAAKALAIKAASEGKGYFYTNPGTNQGPVSGITWIELTSSNKFSISGQWSGSGLLIINGNNQNVALDISGGGKPGEVMSFTGMIWVIGAVKIAGNADITGAIFAESAQGIESDATGNCEIDFNSTAVTGAFGLLGGAGPGKLTVLSWQEL